MKLIKKLGLVALPIVLMAIVLVQGLGAIGNAAVGEYSCYCTQPLLRLTQEKVYWGSYADYTNGTLSIDYDVSNDSTNYANAHNLQILGTSNSEGVTSISHGRSINMVSAGECELVTVQYKVPAGVNTFHTSVYATTKDQCGNSYNYPGPMP
ncbi:MAG: hypothetical protein ACYCXF_00055 [Thermoleophilia bacterium]